MKPVTFSVFRNEFRSAIKREIEDKMGINSGILDILDMKAIDKNAHGEYEDYIEAFYDYKTTSEEYILEVINSYI